MRIAASVFFLFLTLATTAGAQSPAVRVFLTDNLASMTDNLSLAVREGGGLGVADGWGIAEWAFREFAGRDECQGLDGHQPTVESALHHLDPSEPGR